MTDSKKRKEGSGDDRSKGLKKSKGGSGGKWQTPHHAAKLASRGSGKIEAGDIGIWATCSRRMEGRATEELKAMFEECAERFYGLSSGPDEAQEERESVDDIEASIRKEVESMDNKKGLAKMFSPVHLDLECVLFFKTQPPIDPVDFVHRICTEVVSKSDIRRMRYVQRLTPVTIIGKATDKGLEDVGKTVLGAHFQLSGEEGKEGEEESEERTPYSYAIRPTIRNHTALKRDVVIKQVAEMVGDMHKVDLTSPDKVIIVEIYQTVCGMSVVGSDWEKLKRFNLAELYQHQRPIPTNKADAKSKMATRDETRQAEAPLATSTDSLVR